MGFELVAGRSFGIEFARDSIDAAIVNQTAVRLLGYDNALGQVFRLQPKNREYRIVGVVKDFNYARLQNPIGPVVFRYDPASFSYALIKVQPGTFMDTVYEIERKWLNLSQTNDNFSYRLLDEHIRGAYNDFRDIIGVLGMITGLAIFISCLGLLGISIFSTETRTKEIGIRKVLGARSVNLVLMLSMDMIKLLGLSIVIACILGWLFVNKVFVMTIANRVDFNPILSILGILLVSLSALMTICSQTLRAAFTNPTDTLREE